jgi:hypothetical protein
MDALIDGIGEALDDGRPRTRAELAEDIGARHGPRAAELLRGSWGSTLKVASDRHYLVQSADDDAGVRFTRASRWLGTWRDEDKDEALAMLVERYLAVYGPATLRELLRWWGVAETSVMKPILAALGDEVAEVDIAGTRAFVRSTDIDQMNATRPGKDDVQLVGGFDPYIVGAGLREQLIPAAHLKRVSRTAGWISPVVLVDGIVGGVWDATRSGTTLAVTVELFARPNAKQRRAIAGAAEPVARVQCLDATVAYGPVFPEKASKVSFKDR